MAMELPSDEFISIPEVGQKIVCVESGIEVIGIFLTAFRDKAKKIHVVVALQNDEFKIYELNKIKSINSLEKEDKNIEYIIYDRYKYNYTDLSYNKLRSQNIKLHQGLNIVLNYITNSNLMRWDKDIYIKNNISRIESFLKTLLSEDKINCISIEDLHQKTLSNSNE